MRKQVCIGVLAMSFLVSMLAVAPASAKSGTDVRAQISFDFHVGDNLMLAGDYDISALNDDGSALRIGDGKRSTVALTNSKEAKAGSESRSRLVFHKYGDQYFLAAVWGADQTGRVLRESKRERRLRREMRVAQSGGAAMEIVTVNAQ
jgi:hypothetical protein